MCSIDGCDQPQLRRQLCNRHYKRLLKHGDPMAGGAFRSREPLADRFWLNVNKGPECWQWVGAVNKDGYGELRRKGRHHLAHRLSYELAGSALHDGTTLDHICRNRTCVNPGHLRPASKKQNGENLATRRNNSSGYRGVSWHSPSGLWHVTAVHHGHQHSGGYFKDPEEANVAAIALRNRLYTHNAEDRMLTA